MIHELHQVDHQLLAEYQLVEEHRSRLWGLYSWIISHRLGNFYGMKRSTDQDSATGLGEHNATAKPKIAITTKQLSGRKNESRTDSSSCPAIVILAPSIIAPW
jgi:hypothetical protein